jgi:hypothetical protein
MRPAVAYMQGTVARLYWFDSFAAAQVTTDLDPGITSVFLSMDDKRAVASLLNTNDIILLYIRDRQLFYAQQRDRFRTPRVLASFTGTGTRILRAGMNTGGRFQIEIDPGRDPQANPPTIPLTYVIPVGIDLSGARGL